MKLKAGDNVVVITGKSKGKTGKILKILNKKDRVIIEDVNKVKRHIKKTAQRPGEIREFEASIHSSNVMILDPKTKKRARITYKKDAAGKKIRVTKQGQNTL